VTKIPAGLLMFHEGDAGWTTDNSRDVPSAFNPCGGADVTAVGRTDARTLRGPGPQAADPNHSPIKLTYQLLLFGTEQAATTAFLKLSAGGCGWTNEVMNAGDADSTHWARLYHGDGYGYNPEPGVYWLHDAVLVRTGNVLLVAYFDEGGAGMNNEDFSDDNVNNILRPLCEAGLVCR
jgi:hypothetical protein